MKDELQTQLNACEAACETLRETAQQLWKKLNSVVNEGGGESYFTIEAAKQLLEETAYLIPQNPQP
jgi:hypothetical protein